MRVRPLHPHAALLAEDGTGSRLVAVTDLHLGLEAELDAKGVTMRHDYAEEMAERISGLLQSEGAERLVLLGDIKHKVGAISRQEWDEIPEFLKKVSGSAEVYLIPGNHDGNIRSLAPQDINVISSKGMVLEDTLFLHGHSMPSDLRQGVRRIVMGHLHPVFRRQGSLINGERVWIHLRAKKQALFAGEGLVDIIVVPSFNELYGPRAGGYRKAISPIISRVMEDPRNLQSCVVARLDGSVVGDESALADIL